MCYVVIRRRLSTFGTRELHDYEILLLIESRCLRFLYVKGIFYGAYAKLAPKYLTTNKLSPKRESESRSSSSSFLSVILQRKAYRLSVVVIVW